MQIVQELGSKEDLLCYQDLDKLKLLKLQLKIRGLKWMKIKSNLVQVYKKMLRVLSKLARLD